MIRTLTLNPCVDKTLWVQEFGQTPLREEMQSGGKGLNAARVLTALRVPCLAIAPLGGQTGETCLALALSEGIPIQSVPIKGNTRTVVTQVRERDFSQRVDFETPPDLSEKEVDRVRAAALDGLHEGDVLAILGSACSASAAHLGASLIGEARLRGAKTFLDSNKELLRLAAVERPDVLKINLTELSQLRGKEITLGEAADEAAQLGIERVIVTLGDRGAVLAMDGRMDFCPAPRVETVNPVGSGDSFTAAWLCAMTQGFGDRFALAAGCAAGAANARVFPAARLHAADIEALLGYTLAL